MKWWVEWKGSSGAEEMKSISIVIGSSFIINLHKYYTTHKYNKIKYRVNVKIVEGGEEQEIVLCKRVFNFVSFSSIFNL